MSNLHPDSDNSTKASLPPKIPREVIKKSFVERLTMAFIKRVLFGGLKVLKDKNNVFWGGITMVLILTTGIIAALSILPNYYVGMPQLVSPELLQTFINFQILVAITFLLVAFLRWIGTNTKWSMLITIILMIPCAVMTIYFIFLQNQFLNFSPEPPDIKCFNYRDHNRTNF